MKRFAEPAIEVRHADLTLASQDSPYRVFCPVCKSGVLFVGRDQRTLRLVRTDRCIMCYQRVLYLDAQINGEPLTPVEVSIDIREIMDPPGMHCERLGDDATSACRRGECPDCGVGKLQEGPHGGLSVNYDCDHCGQRFCDLGPFGVDRIRFDTDKGGTQFH